MPMTLERNQSGLFVPTRRIVQPGRLPLRHRPQRQRKHRPWCPLRMAAGDVLLQSDGSVTLDDAGNVMLVGADPCDCCPDECPCPSASLCQFNACTPTSIRVVLTDLAAIGETCESCLPDEGCLDGLNFSYCSASVTGSFPSSIELCLEQSPSNPCLWFYLAEFTDYVYSAFRYPDEGCKTEDACRTTHLYARIATSGLSFELRVLIFLHDGLFCGDGVTPCTSDDDCPEEDCHNASLCAEDLATIGGGYAGAHLFYATGFSALGLPATLSNAIESDEVGVCKTPEAGTINLNSEGTAVLSACCEEEI